MALPPDALRQFLKCVSVYSCLNIDDASEEPGLYAWYGILAAGPKDWALQLNGGEDEGEAASRTLLQKHCSRFDSPPLQLKARGTFSSRWRGDLRDISSQHISSVLNGSAEDEDEDELQWGREDGKKEEARGEILAGILRSESDRRLLLDTLTFATPILSAPLYIGVATRLRQRLRQHVDSLIKYSEAINRNPSLKEKLLQHKRTNFASRAVGMGFSPDMLSVWTLPLAQISKGEHPEDKLRDIAEVVEWFLNRWNRPLLGKR